MSRRVLICGGAYRYTLLPPRLKPTSQNDPPERAAKSSYCRDKRGENYRKLHSHKSASNLHMTIA